MPAATKFSREELFAIEVHFPFKGNPALPDHDSTNHELTSKRRMQGQTTPVSSAEGYELSEDTLAQICEANN